MVQGCRTSGVLTATALVFTGQCKLISIHATDVGAGACILKVYDSLSASGFEVARITLTSNQTVEFDMHGVICRKGLYFEEVSGSAAVSIEFS